MRPCLKIKITNKKLLLEVVTHDCHLSTQEDWKFEASLDYEQRLVSKRKRMNERKGWWDGSACAANSLHKPDNLNSAPGTHGGRREPTCVSSDLHRKAVTQIFIMKERKMKPYYIKALLCVNIMLSALCIIRCYSVPLLFFLFQGKVGGFGRMCDCWKWQS